MPRKKRADPDELTARQVEGLRLLARGYERRDLAARWFICRVYVAELMLDAKGKLGVRTDAAAVVAALQRGLIEMPAAAEMRGREEIMNYELRITNER